MEVGNHFVWEFLSGQGAVNIHPSAAILQHYRVCEFGGEDCLLAPSVIDRTAQRFGTVLETRIKQKWAELKESCKLPDLEAVAAAAATSESQNDSSGGKPKEKPKCKGKSHC